MKKVLVAMPSLYNGGAERSLVNMLNELPSDQYEIDLLLLKREGMFLKQLPTFVDVLETPKEIKLLYSPLFKNGKALPIVAFGNLISKLFTKNSRECKAFRWKYFYGPFIKPLEKHYDVALAYISNEILYLIDEKINADKKIVWIHNDYRSALHPKKYDYPHLKNMDAIVSISDSCVDILKQEFPEYKNKIYMLENITSSKVIRNKALEFYPKEYEIKSIKILSIGRLYEQKGFDIAIEAAAKLKKEGYDFLWLIIGTGEDEKQLNEMIHHFGLEDSFKLIGARENPYCYIKNCDIFVQPSRYEGKSVVLDEAKIIGTPIIATNYPTVADQLKDNYEGLVVDLSAEGVYNGVKQLIDHSEVRERLKDNLLQNEYGNQAEIDKYISLMEM